MIKPEHFNKLKQLLPPSGWFIAGGSLLDKAKDIDIYFIDQHTASTVIKQFGEADYTTSNAHTYKNSSGVIPSKAPIIDHYDIQLIVNQFGTPEQILADFDLNKSRQAMLPEGTLYQHPTFHDDLYFELDKFQSNTLSRLTKYIYQKKQTLDFTKFQTALNKLVYRWDERIPHYYEKKVKSTVGFQIRTFMSVNMFYVPYIIKAIDQLPANQRLKIYDFLIKSHTKILPLPHFSPELQLYTATRGQNTKKQWDNHINSIVAIAGRHTYPPYPTIEIPQVVIDTYPEHLI